MSENERQLSSLAMLMGSSTSECGAQTRPFGRQGTLFVETNPRARISRVSDSYVAGKTLDQIRILIVDDDDDARDLLSTVLRQRGASVVCAPNAREAFELLRQE